MKNALILFLAVCAMASMADVTVANVTAQQRYPWNGKVDIIVTIQGASNEIVQTECIFAATNSATLASVPVTTISQVGDDEFLGDVCTRRYLWNATNDVGVVKIDDLSLTINVKELGGVQLWENGPYWAECNVGATKPEEYGYYFWWGDTVGYTRNAANDGWVSVQDGSSFEFDSSNCPTFGKDNSTLQSLGYIDSTGNLVAAHDAATVHLGVPWRMPTDAEMSALVSNCDTTWMTRNGVAGRLVAGRGAFASKSIFLPAAGLGRPGSNGFYWSSTPHSDLSFDDACNLRFASGYFTSFFDDRYFGLPVRPLQGLDGGATAITTHLELDCRIGARTISEDGKTLYFDASWYESSAEIKISDNDVVLTNGIFGSYGWFPRQSCVNRHTLKLEAVSANGEVVEAETADFIDSRPTLDHTAVVSKPAVAPTRSNAGWTAEIICSKCGVIIQAATEIPALGYVRNVTAKQRYPWSGLVDIVVTLQGNINDIVPMEYVFSATNTATQLEVPVSSIRQVGSDVVSGDVCTRRYLWNATNDVGAVKIDDLALMVDVKLGGVQLWENGPYWAECNVGASKPEEYGYYFWWGDTIGYIREGGTLTYNYGWGYKDVTWVSSSGTRMSSSPFSSSTCPTDNKDNSTLQSLGYIDSTGNLVSAHDAATAHFGTPWRMPTDTEFVALTNNCTTTWTIRNGVYGQLVMGKGAYASKSVFFPAAGYGGGLWYRDFGDSGRYWSSTTHSYGEYHAWSLDVFSSCLYRVINFRTDGMSVRPLREFDGGATTIALVGAGVTTHLKLDCRTGVHTISENGETLYFDTSWYDNSETISITDNGTEIGSGTTGSVFWKSSVCGSHTLQLRAISSGGDQVGEEGAEFTVPHTSVFVPAIAVTCTASGREAGTKCSICDAYLSGGEVISALGHAEEIVQSAVAATCTESGYAAEMRCSRCGVYLSGGEVISALGHEEEIVQSAVVATCTESGYTAEMRCSRCGVTLQSREVVSALGHDLQATITAITATCTTAGRTAEIKCSRCGLISQSSATIAELGHSGVITQPAIEATSSTAGRTAEIRCSRCNELLQAATEIPAFGYVCTVTAKQRYPWSGLVDIVVTLQGDTNDIAQIKYVFSATNTATQMDVPISSIRQVGSDVVSGDVCTRRYLWNATNDVGAVKIDDLSLTINVKELGGVQLWENGPYWAECNVGATKPEEYGYYFWWGDTVGYKRNAANDGWVSVKDESSFAFDSSNCPTFGKDSSTLQSLGYIDSAGNLVAAHDAATVHLGVPWRMPTDAELSELISKCDTIRMTRNGVDGRLVTGRGAFASKSIFLPAAGWGGESDLDYADSIGGYWPSTPDSADFNRADSLYFYLSSLSRCSNGRYRGMSVRPLREFDGGATTIALVGAGVTTHLKLDCRTGVHTISENGETLYFDTSWYDNSETISITDNGTEIGSGTTGSVFWKSSVCGSHTLQLRAISSGGDQVGEEGAEFTVPHTSVFVPAIAVTCTASGREAGTKCSICDAYLSGGEVISALGHAEEIVQSAVAATCTESGYTAEIKCSRCGVILQSREVVSALGHDLQTTITAVAATCTTAGQTAEIKCSRCGVISQTSTTIAALGHSGVVTVPAVEPTSSTAGSTAEIRCSRCNELLQFAAEIPALGYIRNVTARHLWPHKKVEVCYDLADDIGDVASLAVTGDVSNQPVAEDIDGVGWSGSYCNPDRWFPSVGNLLYGIDAEFSGERYIESSGSAKSTDSISYLTDGIVNGAGKAISCYTNTFAIKNGTLTWMLPQASALLMLRINTHWGDGGRDGINLLSVAIKRSGSENWETLPNSCYQYGLGDNSSSDGNLEFIYRNASGTVFAKDVVAIRFSLGDQDNSGSGFTEFEVVGGSSYSTSGSPLKLTAGKYSARSILGNSRCVPGAHRIVWDAEKDGVSVDQTNLLFTVAYSTASNVGTGCVNTTSAVCDGMSVGSTMNLGCSAIDAQEGAVKIDDITVFSVTDGGSFNWQPITKGEHTITHIAGTNVWTRTVNVTSLVYEEPTPNPPTEEDENVSLKTSGKNVAASGGTCSIGTSGTSGYTWTATTSADWLTFNGASSKTVGSSAIVRVAANTGVETRIGYVYVSGHVFTITQAGVGGALDSTSAEFGSDGGEGEFSVMVDSAVSWRARSNVDWISVETLCGTGETEVVYHVAPWNKVSTRSGTITAAGCTFTVNQTGRPMKLSVESVEKDYLAHDIILTVDALSSTEWGIALDASWLSIVERGSGKGAGTVTLAINENPSYSNRMATALIGSEILTIVQTGRPTVALAFAISPGATTASVKGANGVIAVEATPDLPWSATSQANWLTVMPGFSSGTGNGNVVYAATPNPTMAERVGTIVVTPIAAPGLASHVHTVTQSAATSMISVDSHTFAADGDSFAVEVTVDDVVAWTIDYQGRVLVQGSVQDYDGYVPISDGLILRGVDLDEITSISGSLGGTWIHGGEPIPAIGYCFKRTDDGLWVQFQGVDSCIKCVCVLFTQKGDDVYGSVQYAKYNEDQTLSLGVDFDVIQGSQTTTCVASDSDGGYGVKDLSFQLGEKWVSIDGSSDRNGPGTVTIAVEPNMSIEPRDATITIAGHEFTILQKGRSVAVTYTSNVFDVEGDEGDVDVVPDGNVTWTAFVEEKDNWISLWLNEGDGTEDGNSVTCTGTGNLGYYVDEYVGDGSLRTGKIYIGDQVVYITQRAYELSIDPCATNVAGNAGAGSVAVPATAGQVWNAIATEPWIAVVNTNGMGKGTVNYTFTDNDTGETRTGKIIISGEEYTITQAARQLVMVTATVMGEGEVKVKGEGEQRNAYSFDRGTTVELTAVASNEWRFVRWEKDGSVVDDGTPTLPVTADVDQEIVAVFEKIPVYTVNGESIIEGTIKSFTASSPVVMGGTTQLVCLGTSAYPNKGTSFQMQVTGNIDFDWDLWQTNYLVAISQTSGGTVSGTTGWVAAGTEVTFTATPAAGKSLYRWSGFDGIASNDSSLTIRVSHPLTVSAIFGTFDDTLATAADAPTLTFTTGGDAVWTPVIDATAQMGYSSIRSGTIGKESESWVETTVSGTGTLAFRWKTDCEHDDGGEATWDRLAIFVNGVEKARLDGTTAWQTVEIPLTDAKSVIRWSLYRDDYDASDEAQKNCGWIDSVEVK